MYERLKCIPDYYSKDKKHAAVDIDTGKDVLVCWGVTAPYILVPSSEFVLIP